MPALPAAAKTLKIEFKHSYGGDTDVLSGIYATYTGTAPSVAELTTFATAVGAAWDANMASLANSTNVSLQQVKVTDLSSATSAEAEVAAVFAGTRTGAGVSAGDCAVIAYEIARRYRGGHARGYWPLGNDADLESPQTWTSAFATAFNDGFIGMFAAIAAAGWSGAGTIAQVNVSYFEGFTVVTSPTTHRARNVPTVRATPVIDVVTGTIGRTTLGTQRRRIHRLR